jgi:hypothetical protein
MTIVTEKTIKIAPPYIPASHASTHASGGTDPVPVDSLPGVITDSQHGTKTTIPFAHHGDWGHHGTIPTSAPAGGAGRCYVDGSNLYVHDGTSWVRQATKDWNNLINKPSTFPPSAHASSHASGGSDPISIDSLPGTITSSQHGTRTDIPFAHHGDRAHKGAYHSTEHYAGGEDAIMGWISPGNIGPYSNTNTRLFFRTRDISGTSKVDHIFCPSDDGYGFLGDSSDRWLEIHSHIINVGSIYSRYNSSIYFPWDANYDATIRPQTDGCSYIGGDTYRFNLVRAITITPGDLGFEEDRCMVCGEPFKENDSIVLKVRKLDPEHRQILTVPVHAKCNPHKLSPEMLKYHEENVLKPRGNREIPRHNPANFEIVAQVPEDENRMRIQARFDDGISVSPLVPIDASEEEILKAIMEFYARERRYLDELETKRKAGESKIASLGKRLIGRKGMVDLKGNKSQWVSS